MHWDRAARTAPPPARAAPAAAAASDGRCAHLLTTEAFALYFRHLKKDGILAVHISNRYVDLALKK